MGNETRYGYDAKGNVEQGTSCLSYPGGVRTGSKATVERNADGTVSKAYSPAWPTSNPTVYAYTNRQLTSVDPPGADVGSTTATYDGFGRLRTFTSWREDEETQSAFITGADRPAGVADPVWHNCSREHGVAAEREGPILGVRRAGRAPP